MMTAIKKERTKKVSEKTIYMEVLGANRVIYRVTSSKKVFEKFLKTL